MPKTTEPPKLYTDIDYDSFPVADLYLDLHWTDLPRAVIAARDKTQREARAAELLAALPEEHKVILVPADPTYSPLEAVQKCLAPHPAILAAVNGAVALTIDQYRGWTNPLRPSLLSPS